REFRALENEISTNIVENARRTDRAEPTRSESGYRVRHFVAWAKAAHMRASTIIRMLDGGVDNGPLWQALCAPANRAGDRETAMMAQMVEKLTKIIDPVLKLGRMEGKGRHYPTINRSLNTAERLALALNFGNAGNIQRVLDGFGWNMQQVTPVLSSMTATEWQSVQEIWDMLEELRPLIAEKERRVYGKEPDWVEPVPLTVTTADGQTLTLRGGYFPIRYDRNMSSKAFGHEEADAARQALRGAYTSATTRRGFTKNRAERVENMPVLLTLSGLYSGITDVIHDLAWHEWLIDANRILRSEKISDAIRATQGNEVLEALREWVNGNAEGDHGAQHAIDKLLFTPMRRYVSVAGLGLNVISAAVQPLGFIQSTERIGVKWVGRGVAKALTNPRGLARQVNGMSVFMHNRARTMFRELNEIRNNIEGVSRAQQWMGRYGFFLMLRAQALVDYPTWWGGYEKALASGVEEARAIELADQAVIDSQGSGMFKDLSKIERGQGVKIFTVFYSFMGTNLNLAFVAMSQKERGKRLASLFWLMVATPVLSSLLRSALIPDDDDDEWDMDKLAKRLGQEQLAFLMGSFVGLREFQNLSRLVTGDTARYSGPTGLRPIGDAFQFSQQAMQGEMDDAFRKASINLLGDLLGLPSAQINRSWTGAEALLEDDTDNPAALVFGFQKTD
ncbi:MAG: hypothetical protein LBR88_07230, partial [Zoogloeaceae bacterium]|nr:hypothetical protein [Zoogloeaceae bacterium]